MNWISSNIDRIVSLTISHVWLTLAPTVIGLIIALPLLTSGFGRRVGHAVARASLVSAAFPRGPPAL